MLFEFWMFTQSDGKQNEKERNIRKWLGKIIEVNANRKCITYNNERLDLMERDGDKKAGI